MLILTVIRGMELTLNSQQSNQLFLMCFHKSRGPLCKWTKTLVSPFIVLDRLRALHLFPCSPRDLMIPLQGNRGAGLAE